MNECRRNSNYCEIALLKVHFINAEIRMAIFFLVGDYYRSFFIICIQNQVNSRPTQNGPFFLTNSKILVKLMFAYFDQSKWHSQQGSGDFDTRHSYSETQYRSQEQLMFQILLTKYCLLFDANHFL